MHAFCLNITKKIAFSSVRFVALLAWPNPCSGFNSTTQALLRLQATRKKKKIVSIIPFSMMNLVIMLGVRWPRILWQWLLAIMSFSLVFVSWFVRTNISSKDECKWRLQEFLFTSIPTQSRLSCCAGAAAAAPAVPINVFLSSMPE